MRYVLKMLNKKTARSIIILILSLIHYWTGHTTPRVKEATTIWMPECLDVIPLRVWDPRDAQMVVYQGEDS